MKHTDSKQIDYKHNQDSTWCVEDQPLTKVINKGVRSITDTELVAVLLTGIGNATEVARNLYNKADNNLNTLSHFSVEQLTNVNGISSKRAAILHSAFELGRRNAAQSTNLERVKDSGSVNSMLKPLIGDIEHEEFWLVCLNRANKVLGKHKISQGGLSGTVIDTRIILKKSLDSLASSIIVSHNHPSGNTQPSDADIKITEKLKKAAETMEIKLLDHVIITKESYFSFADEGLINQ